jgi:glycosyltransferase involved in cell wall biosynthesis
VVKRIVIVTGASLSWAPRAPKEASALAAGGFDVTVLGVSGNEKRYAVDSATAAACGYKFESLDGADRGGGALVARLLSSVATKVFRASGVATGPLFSPWAKQLEQRARQLNPRLVINHLEPGLRVGSRLVRTGIPCSVDMEDWYAEDLRPEARAGRPVKQIADYERLLLCRARFSTATTEAMADALAEAYGCPRPTRIYNVFPDPHLPSEVPLRDRGPDSRSMGGGCSHGRKAVSIHWFSQTIGPGRGLETLFAAAAGREDSWEIHLRGKLGGYAPWLDEVVPDMLRNRVFVHSAVTNEELPLRIAEHDIGFAGETRVIRSRDLTATNKIFQYLQSGLAVLASDTAGQREVSAIAGDAVRLFCADDSEDLETKLVEFTGHNAHLRNAKESARLAARELCWEKEQQRFLELVHGALAASAE